ncbi:MAG TPA: undecaprenyldiphospho-muramoylpentapeptide beta-N-acetylglucosaminyltransferase [Bryobacteraceae bacterium]|nr:undecaprenyldiphospho-muramoylpentapeptide beta-N-acetylglucosaminyltransferase [Bryobacteraceae bacterium]
MMAGGGTGGHVIPLLAVARELVRRGHEVRFVGTREGLEARLVPAGGFEIEYVRIGGMNRVSPGTLARTLWQLPASTASMFGDLKRLRIDCVFSLGGYAAGPAVLAAAMRRIPLVLMEPNAVPGMTNRWMGRLAKRALVNFDETARFFPKGKALTTGLPVRPEFFTLAPKPRGDRATVLITGGSRGSRTLNNAFRESWPLFRDAGLPVCFIHQTGRQSHDEIAAGFAASGLKGEVAAFIDDMPGAFAQADLIVCRSGAGAVAELAAAGKPAILVPFPFASDDHQRKNAEILAGAGAARLVLDAEMNGRRLFEEVSTALAGAGVLERMGQAARRFARPGAAEKAADIAEAAAGRRL